MSNVNTIFGLNPSGVVVPVGVDANGRLYTTPSPSSSEIVQVADGATPTQLLKVDASGRLTLVPNQTFKMVDSGGVNQVGVDVNGAATFTDLIRYLQVQGKCFGVLEQANTGAAHDVGAAIFTPVTNSKNILLYRIRCSTATSCPFFMTMGTVNPALGALTPYNKNLSSATATTVTATGSNNITPSGTAIDSAELSGAPFEILQNNSYLFMPAGTAQFIEVYIQQAAAGYGSVLFEWAEF